MPLPLREGGLNDPLIMVDPQPRQLDLIFDRETRQRLERLGRLIVAENGPMSDEMVDRHLPDAALIIGQTPMPQARLQRARHLKAIFNVETNFLPNVDYQTCQERGIWVLSPSPAFASAVAEFSLAMAIDLLRGITMSDRAFRVGREEYGLAGNEGCSLFTGAPVGIIGFGDLGRSLRALLFPFHNSVMVYDPWLPDDLIRRHSCTPAALDEVLRASRVVFVFASATTENEGLLGKHELDLIPNGSALILMSRAAIVDFPALVRHVESGRIRAAIDVFPEEPVPTDDPVRSIEGLVLSAHRAGGMPEALFEIGQLTVADAELILRGLPPQLCRRADPTVAARLRSKPIAVT